MSVQIAQYFSGTITQGGADAFVQASELTGIIPSDGEALQVVAIELQFKPNNMLSGISADSDVYWSVTRDTKTAVAVVSDNDCLWSDGFANALTTSGEILLPALHTWVPPSPMLLVEPTVFVQLDSTNTGLTLEAYYRIFYVPVKVSEVDILRLLNASS